jgi:hypothetical protein
MFCSQEIYKKKFSDEISKQAYLRACKWLAQNVYGNENISKNVSVKVEKLKLTKKDNLPTFQITLYFMYDEQIEAAEYCHKCRQLHTILYSVDKPHCDECKMSAFLEIRNEHMRISAETIESIIDMREKENVIKRVKNIVDG